jgi:hypothetical protein
MPLLVATAVAYGCGEATPLTETHTSTTSVETTIGDPPDPTAIPTFTPPPRVPPSPDPLFTPSPYVSPTESVFEVLVPAPGDVKLAADGKYYADGPRGCPWSEIRRRQAIDPITGEIDHDAEEVVLSNPCDDDVLLRFNSQTGEVALYVVD